VKHSRLANLPSSRLRNLQFKTAQSRRFFLTVASSFRIFRLYVTTALTRSFSRNWLLNVSSLKLWSPFFVVTFFFLQKEFFHDLSASTPSRQPFFFYSSRVFLSLFSFFENVCQFCNDCKPFFSPKSLQFPLDIPCHTLFRNFVGIEVIRAPDPGSVVSSLLWAFPAIFFFFLL